MRPVGSTQNAQIWDEYHIHYGANIGGALGLPSTGGCEFGVCINNLTGGQDGSPVTSSTILSYSYDIAQDLIYSKQNRTPSLRIAGTHYCGPGGAGTPNSDVDSACKAHDACYTNHGIDFGPNIGWGGWTKQQAAEARSCNQTLYDTVKQYPNEPGSQAIQKWLRYGGWLGILYPGTSSH